VIGTYTERVTIQAMTRTNNGGQPVETWATSLTRVPASVTTAVGPIERVFGAQVQGESSHVVRMAAPSDDVPLTGRLVWHSRHGDRTLTITGKVLTQDSRTRELVLACAEARTV